MHLSFSKSVFKDACRVLLLRSSVTSGTSSSSSSTSQSFSSLSSPVSVQKPTSACFHDLQAFFIVVFLPLALLLSELEPCVERARLPPSPVRSDLRASAVLRADPDPHLLGLPNLSIPLGAAAAVVLGVDAPHRVSERNTLPQSKNEQTFWNVAQYTVFCLFLSTLLFVYTNPPPRLQCLQPDITPQRIGPQWHGGGRALHHELWEHQPLLRLLLPVSHRCHCVLEGETVPAAQLQELWETLHFQSEQITPQVVYGLWFFCFVLFFCPLSSAFCPVRHKLVRLPAHHLFLPSWKHWRVFWGEAMRKKNYHALFSRLVSPSRVSLWISCLQIVCVPFDWRLKLFALIVVNAAVSCLAEVRHACATCQLWAFFFPLMFTFGFFMQCAHRCLIRHGSRVDFDRKWLHEIMWRQQSLPNWPFWLCVFQCLKFAGCVASYNAGDWYCCSVLLS